MSQGNMYNAKYCGVGLLGAHRDMRSVRVPGLRIQGFMVGFEVNLKP